MSGGKSIADILLHGEEEIEYFRELVVDNEYQVSSKVVDVIDKGKMCIIAMTKTIS